MSKFLLFFPLLLNAAFISLPYDFSLKKDETINFNVVYKNKSYDLSLRWTLYKNEVLIILYKYDGFPYQITLFKNYPIDIFRIKVVDFDNSPYLYIKVMRFSDKITEFEMFLGKNRDIKIDLKGKK